MDIYLLIIEDRRDDVEVLPFRQLADAMNRARRYLSQFQQEWIEEEIIEGWEFYARYGVESDSVRIVKAVLT